MSKPEGLYMSVDHRLTKPSTGELVDDGAVKFLRVDYPGGVRALMAFTGVAALPSDNTPVGDWLRETIRGHSEPFDVSMAHLHVRLNRDVGKHPQHLIVIVMAMDGENGGRFWGGFTNEKASGFISREFHYRMTEWTDAGAIATGFPAAKANADGLFDVVKKQVEVRPRNISDHMNLLAAVNRRVAESDERRAKAEHGADAVGTVSSVCHVSFVNAVSNAVGEKSGPWQGIYNWQPGDEPVPFVMPFITNGIDTRYVSQKMVEAFDNSTVWTGGDPDEHNKHLKRRP
jgi:hypothetical protein